MELLCIKPKVVTLDVREMSFPKHIDVTSLIIEARVTSYTDFIYIS